MRRARWTSRPRAPSSSFESQLYAMETYANILQERARIEQVDLNAPLEGGESGEIPIHDCWHIVQGILEGLE